jgi:signal transduction histidine kinase
VIDDGPGFPPDFLPHAWERFARGEASRTADGSGLGLAIVRAIAEAHDGQAHAINLSTGGADVWITVPGAPSSAGPATPNGTEAEREEAVPDLDLARLP